MRISILFIFTLIIRKRLKKIRITFITFLLGILTSASVNWTKPSPHTNSRWKKKPNFTVSLYQLAGVYVRKRELRSAIDPLRKLLAEQPTHELGIFTLGQVYAALGDNDGAMQQYYSLQNLNPRLAANLLQQISK